jgi:hypothetical protein
MYKYNKNHMGINDNCIDFELRRMFMKDGKEEREV